MKLVWIEFRDAATFGMWKDIDDARSSEPRPCQCTGFLVFKDDSKTIVSLLSDMEETAVSDWITIPTENIVRIKYLTEGAGNGGGV